MDNVLLIGTVMGLSLREARASVDEILAFAGLERFAGLPLKHYSSGMAARLAYAVAFKAVRDVLVLDEIFAVGDQEFRARCEARYRELHAQGHTVVIVCHEPRIVSTFCARALLLEGGTIVLDGIGRRRRGGVRPAIERRMSSPSQLPARLSHLRDRVARAAAPACVADSRSPRSAGWRRSLSAVAAECFAIVAPPRRREASLEAIRSR